MLTSIAVVLGVGFVSGAYFLTDSLRASFDTVFTEATQGVDVQVTTKEYAKLAQEAATSAPGTVSIDLAKVGVPPEVVDELEGVRGVKRVAGSIFEVGAQPLDKKGRPISTGGAPSFGANWVPEAEETGALRLVKGKAPERGEVLLDATTMDRGRFSVGDDVTILIQGGRTTRTFRISGVIKFGDSNSLNGAAISAFETSEAQELFQMGDRFSAVDAQAESGVSQEQLKRNVARALGPDYKVLTGVEVTQEQTDQIDDAFLGILQNVILGFAAVAVFVGAFTIFNTFTILVGQRTREIGLLRAIGASRRQVLGIVALEALVVGVIASTLGILAGYGIAYALRELINAFADGGIPKEAFPLKTRTIVASYLVGVVVTFVASIVPAIRAARVSPLEALRANPAHAGRGWRAPAFGGLLLLLGGFAVYRGFADKDASVQSTLTLIGGGFAVAIIGVALLSRLFIAPVTHLLGPVFARGTTGQLARRNVLRNRARSATTASALMIGLALASLVLVFQSSIKQTINAEIDRTLGADISIYNSTVLNSGTGVVNAKDVAKIAKVDGVDRVGAQRIGGATVDGRFDTDDVTFVTALNQESYGTDPLLRLNVLDGASEPAPDSILIDEDLAKDHDWTVGDKVKLGFVTGSAPKFEITGIYEPNELLGAPVLMAIDDFNRLQPPAVRADAFVFASVDDGEKPATVARRIEKTLGRDGAYLDVKDTEAFRDLIDQQFAPILGLVLGMLSLSLIIALFGIGNTLALNVFERTREIGLIRAVGGTQRQVRRIIRLEAVLVAVFGAIVGIVVGLAAGRALIAALADQGFEFALSWGGIIGVLIAGFIAGVLSSVLPARRAARTDVLEAIATE
ncbi:MAG: FtsX-like permease family protein [Thermoleophilia bacterium]|nr:FtsX-like permease family protein [Thermoleophilia bacterium]